MKRLDYLREKLADITQQVLSEDDTAQVDFWRGIAIFQNGFAWTEDRGEGLNQLFRTDRERARIKMNAFLRAEFEHLEEGDFGEALAFGLQAAFTELCSYDDDALIEEFSEAVRDIGVVLGFPEVRLGSSKHTEIDRHWRRVGTFH
jgi:hypothetical protein